MAPETDSVSAAPAPRRVVRAPRELAAGLALLVIALFTLWASADLEMGTLGVLGPGMLPRSLAIVLGLAGLAFAALGFFVDGEALERWTLRAPLLVTLGVVGFALTIRTAGLAVAGPLVVIVGGAASSESRPLQLVLFAVVVTAFCIGLFRYALGLPIPILIVGGIYL